MTTTTTYLQKDRVYKLEIGDTSKGTGFTVETSLNVRFQVNKSADNKRKGNQATIEVYNLSPDHIVLMQSEYLVCKFSAGYAATGPLVVVSGNVVECSTTKKGSDFITEITMGEGYSDLNHTKLKQMVAPGKTHLEVIEAIRAQCPNIAKGSYTGDQMNKTTMFGYPLVGTPNQMLRNICEANRMEFNVSGGVLNISDENGLLTKNQALAPVVSESSGLIEVPFYQTAEGRKLPDDKRKRRGVQFKALLNAEYNPGYIIYLESQFITGFYRINTARYSGEFRGQDWYVECFCSFIAAEEL